MGVPDLLRDGRGLANRRGAADGRVLSAAQRGRFAAPSLVRLAPNPWTENQTMGMDVYGKNPTAPEGEYFRNNVWWWHPLAEYVQDVAPEEAGRCRHWHSNSGDGLDAEGAVALAKVLRAEIESGATAKFAAERAAELDAIDDTQCGLCAGTGIRTDAVGVDLNMPSKTVPETDVDGRPNPRAGQTGWCNGCSGRGSRRPAEAQYPFDVENVAEFVSFLEACGGFEIC